MLPKMIQTQIMKGGGGQFVTPNKINDVPEKSVSKATQFPTVPNQNAKHFAKCLQWQSAAHHHDDFYQHDTQCIQKVHCNTSESKMAKSRIVSHTPITSSLRVEISDTKSKYLFTKLWALKNILEIDLCKFTGVQVKTIVTIKKREWL